jgi:hypothetical protein
VRSDADRPAPADAVAGVPTVGVLLPSAPAIPAAPAGVAAPSTGAASTPAPSPAAQLAAVFPPLRLAADGVHRLSLQLHPADLGPVSVLAEIRGGEIHVHLAAASEAGREALRTALPELRRDLQAAGFSTGTLDLQQDGPGQGQPRHQQAGGPAPEQPTQPAPRPRPAPAAIPFAAQPTGASRQLDLHL